MLTIFGSIAVSAIMVSYWLEPRSKWFFCSSPAVRQPPHSTADLWRRTQIIVIEAVWDLIALRRFASKYQATLASN